MRFNLTQTAAFALLLAGLGGCAAPQGTYPSLAMRPFESGSPPADTPEPAAPIRPLTPHARLAELREAAAGAHNAFSAREDDAARLVRAAAGQPFESDARASAMIALAELDAQRGKTARALAALDSLAAEAAGTLSPDPALREVQGEVAATLAREDEAIARLWAILGR